MVLDPRAAGIDPQDRGAHKNGLVFLFQFSAINLRVNLSSHFGSYSCFGMCTKGSTFKSRLEQRMN